MSPLLVWGCVRFWPRRRRNFATLRRTSAHFEAIRRRVSTAHSDANDLQGRGWADDGRHEEDRHGRHVHGPGRRSRGLFRLCIRYWRRGRRVGVRRCGGRRGEGGPRRQGEPAGQRPEERGQAHRGRVHRLHRGPAEHAGRRTPRSRREASPVRGVLLGRCRGGQPEALLALPRCGQEVQREDDVLPERCVPAAGGEEGPLQPAPARAGPIRHRLQRHRGDPRHPGRGPCRLEGRQRDRYPLQRPLLRRGRRRRDLVRR